MSHQKFKQASQPAGAPDSIPQQGSQKSRKRGGIHKKKQEKSNE